MAEVSNEAAPSGLGVPAIVARSSMRKVTSLASALVAVEIVPAVLLVAASLISTKALPYALAGMSVLWLARWLAQGHPSRSTPLDWPILLMVALLPVTLWVTIAPGITTPQVYRLLVAIGFYYSIVNWGSSATRLRWLGWGLIAAGFMLVILAPFSVGAKGVARIGFIPALHLTNFSPDASTETNANVLAGSLAILFAFGSGLLAFAGQDLSPVKRAAVLLMLLLTLGALALTGSRGALVAAAVTLLVLIGLRWRRAWLFELGAAIAGALLLWRLALATQMGSLVASKAIGALVQRREIWLRAIYMIEDFPFTGVGMGNFAGIANLLYPFPEEGVDPIIPHAHNLFLQVAVDLGLLGLAAWLGMLVFVVYAAWQIHVRGRETHDAWLAGLGAGLLCAQVALIAHGLTDAVVWGTRPAVLVWAMWGLTVAAWIGITRTLRDPQ